MYSVFAVRANSKFQFVRAAVSKIFIPKQLLQINLEDSLSVNCFVNFFVFVFFVFSKFSYLFDKTFSTFLLK